MADEQTAQQQFDGAREDTDKQIADLKDAVGLRSLDDEEIITGLEKLGYARDGGPVDVTPGMKALFALTGVSADRDDLRRDVETLKAEHHALVQRAEKAEAALTKSKARVTRDDVPAKPRALKAMDNGLTGDALDAALATAQAEGKKIEIGFSDGKREVAGIAPATVEGEVWKTHARGLMLRDPIKVKGPDAGGASFRIEGYALLIDGKQVAWCQRSDPLAIAPGQEINLADDIWF